MNKLILKIKTFFSKAMEKRKQKTGVENNVWFSSTKKKEENTKETKDKKKDKKKEEEKKIESKKTKAEKSKSEKEPVEKKKKQPKEKKPDKKKKEKAAKQKKERPIKQKKEKPEEKSKTAKAFRTVGKSLLALFLGLLIGISGFVAYAVLINPLTVFDESGFKNSENEAIEYYTEAANITQNGQQDELDVLTSLADKEIMEGIVNIAIIGVDYDPIRETSEWKTKDKQFFADVMLVLALNFNEGTVDMINIPRDTYWGIHETPGYYKLNMSFYAGGEFEGNGFYYTSKSMENVLGGIPVDYYIGVTMPVVKEIVDILGGVEFDIKQKMRIGDRVLLPGQQHLDGQQALDYLRVRQKRNPGLGNDIKRVDRQKELLVALFSQAKESKKLLSIPKIISAMEGRVFTNMTYQQLSSIVIFGMSVDGEDIGLHTFKGAYNYTMANHHLYILYPNGRQELIKEVYGIDVEKSDKYNKTTFNQEAFVVKAGKLAYYAQKNANRGAYGTKDTTVLQAASSLKSAIKSGEFSKIESKYYRLRSLVGDFEFDLYYSDFNKDGLPYNG